MIRIKNVHKEKTKNGKCRLSATIFIDQVQKKLWYEVDSEYSEYLVDDRADGFAVAYVNYAMLNNHDIVSEVPVTDNLLYNLNVHYIPALSKQHKKYNSIKINACSIEGIKSLGSAVGTGMSAGVDSFATFLINSSTAIPNNQKVTHLTFFNVGAVQSSNTYKYSKDDILAFEREDIRQQSLEINEMRFQRSKKIAEELGLPLVRVESNMLEVQPYKHKPLHTQRSISAVLILQKLFSTYYFASTFSISDFKIDPTDPSYYDIFSLNMLSTRATQFISGDLAYTRVEKTDYIKENEIVKKNLNVCWREGNNCGKCDKCIRTLITLDLLGVINEYNEVFDIDFYKKHRDEYLAYAAVMSLKSPYFKQIIDYAKLNNIRYFSNRVRVHTVKIVLNKAMRRL